MEGYVNIDYNRNLKADVYHDLNKFPYPFEGNYFEEIYCHHILEHVEDLLKTMEELWRISKPGCRILIFGPHSSSFEMHVDLTHKRGLNTQTFRRCFLPEGDTWGFYTKAKFKVLKDYIRFYEYMKPVEYFVNKSRRFKNIYERHLSFIIQPKEMRVVLEVIK